MLPNSVQKWRRDCLAVQAQGEHLGNCSPVANSAAAEGMSILSVSNFIGECRELCMQTLMTLQYPSLSEQRNGTKHAMMCFPRNLAVPASHQKPLSWTQRLHLHFCMLCGPFALVSIRHITWWAGLRQVEQRNSCKWRMRASADGARGLAGHFR